jgi:hypothetical protein
MEAVDRKVFAFYRASEEGPPSVSSPGNGRSAPLSDRSSAKKCSHCRPTADMGACSDPCVLSVGISEGLHSSF